MKSYLPHQSQNTGLSQIASRIGMLAAVAVCITISTMATVAAPPNDNFANAQTFSGMSGTVNGTNVGATLEAGEPAHALNRGGGSVWYKYVAPGNGVLLLNTAASVINTQLAVYQGTNLSNLKLIAANDDSHENFSYSEWARVRLGAKTGDIFYIAIDGFNDNGVVGSETGAVGLNFFFQNVVSNDNFANALPIHHETDRLHVTTNVGASKEPGEPDHAGNPGGKSVWYKWTPVVSAPKTFAFSIDSVGVNGPAADQTLFAIYTGTSLNTLTEVARGAKFHFSKAVFTALPGHTYYIAIDGFDSGQGAYLVTTTLNYGPYKTDKVPDLDCDGKADLTVFRPITGTWYSMSSVTGKMQSVQWGTNGDRPLIADINRDGKIEYTVFRPDTGIWFIDRSDTINFIVFNWGLSADIPMILRRHDSNGLNDGIPVAFRPESGTWYQYLGPNSKSVSWGQPGDIPVLEDFTGDGLDEITVFRPATGTWYILLNQTSFENQQVQFGLNGDRPVVADYDGDGRVDIAVFRPSNKTWYILRSLDGQYQIETFGLATDKLQPADYDGDGKTDIGIFRPSTGAWWYKQSSDGAIRTVQFGLNGDIPATAPVS